MNSSDEHSPTEDFYSPLMRSGFLKTFSLSFVAASTVAGIVLTFAMIWFEKFGSDKKRTILNQVAIL